MSFVALFPWILLVVLLATIVPVCVALAMMPGHVARNRSALFGRPRCFCVSWPHGSGRTVVWCRTSRRL